MSKDNAALLERLVAMHDRFMKAQNGHMGNQQDAYHLIASCHEAWDEARAALSGSPQVEAGAVAWLVESFAGRPACYLESFEWVSRMGTLGHDPVWTADHMKALRFSRQVDAEKIAAALDSTDKAKATEHKWIGAALNTELSAIAAKAREWAEHYDQSSDGRNTFILFAEWVESRPREQEGGEALDERAMFEEWAHADSRHIDPQEYEEATPDNNHYYAHDSTNHAYIGWCARAALRAHPAPLPADGWNYDMASAPRDGRELILAVKLRSGVPGRMLVGHYMPGGHSIEDHPPIDGGWYFWSGCQFDKAAEPTAWRPLPTPPASTEGGPMSNEKLTGEYRFRLAVKRHWLKADEHELVLQVREKGRRTDLIAGHVDTQDYILWRDAQVKDMLALKFPADIEAMP